MCLAIPGRVVELVDDTFGQLALVDVVGVSRKINVGMLEGDEVVGPGDWVLIHMGFALSKVDEAEATRALDGLQLLGQTDEDRPDGVHPDDVHPDEVRPDEGGPTDLVDGGRVFADQPASTPTAGKAPPAKEPAAAT